MKKTLLLLGTMFLVLSCNWMDAFRIVDLSTITGDYEALDGDILTGILADNYKITIADGATVKLKNAVIYGVNDEKYPWAGITALGNATLVLKETNIVKGFHAEYPGIYVPEGNTLVIEGDGKLNVSSNGYAAGIGCGYKHGRNCGNIVIQGGEIYATAGTGSACIGASSETTCGDITIITGFITADARNSGGAGIGCGSESRCGDITISGGAITAEGGLFSAGIGSSFEAACGNILISGGIIMARGGESAAGIGSGCYGSVGNITLTNDIMHVTAEKGDGGEGDEPTPHSIGAGSDCTGLGTVTIGGVVGPVSESPFIYQPK